MNTRLSPKMTTVALGMALIVLFGALAGCASSDPAESSTTSLSVSTSTSTMPDTTTTTFDLLTEWDRKLNRVAVLQNELANVLSEEGVDQNDPRMGVFQGLRALTHAIACRGFLDKGNLEMADTAVQEMRYALNRAGNVATGPAAQVVADGRAIVQTLSKPSTMPEEAVTLLDEFMEAMIPLVDEAEALVPADHDH